MPADIRACYNELNFDPPSSISSFLTSLMKQKPKQLLRSPKGYALEKQVFDTLEAKYGRRAATVKADRLLVELPYKVPDLAERTFLDEALICFRNGAFRAAIVMTWNLAYHHLCDFVLRRHLTAFNTQWPKTYAVKHKNARVSAIATHDDFAELKEYEVIQICRSANIISNDLHKLLNEKLGKRNSAAHPSSITIAPHTAEEYIIDLITNVVLKLV